MSVSKQELTGKDQKDADNSAVESSDEFADTAGLGEEEFADTGVWESNKKLTENTEGSVEIDVESLVAEFEAEAINGVDASGRIRRRLEAIAERKRRHEELKDLRSAEGFEPLQIVPDCPNRAEGVELSLLRRGLTKFRQKGFKNDLPIDVGLRGHFREKGWVRLHRDKTPT